MRLGNIQNVEPFSFLLRSTKILFCIGKLRPLHDDRLVLAGLDAMK